MDSGTFAEILLLAFLALVLIVSFIGVWTDDGEPQPDDTPAPPKQKKQ